jgi:hypothetical protein
MPKNVPISLGFIAAAALACALAGCGGGRTTAATQPSPAAFVAATSDAKALALVDEMLGKVGGAAWVNVKQLSWDQKYNRDGKLAALYRHYWDRWNGRHRFEQANMDSYNKSMAETGNDKDTSWVIAFYDLFDKDHGSAMVDSQVIASSEKHSAIDAASNAFQADAYRLTVHLKIKDPGVILKHEGQVNNVVSKYCNPSCDLIRISFDKAVGTDTYFLSINTQSKMPEVFEKQMQGNARLGYALLDWVDAGGIKFPSRFQNLGLEGEVLQVENIKVGEPDDSLYIVPTK